jgi:transposase
MLTVEARFVIKDWYSRGISISEIARITGHDRKTVRKLLAEPVLPLRLTRQRRVSKLDPFVPYLEQRIDQGVLNCNKLLVEIVAQGYDGGKSILKNFVQPFRQARQEQATVRYETEPGEQAQIDWAHFGMIEHHGVRRRLYGFLMTLSWSRAMYLEFTISCDTISFLHAFAYLGGVPKTVLHDNLKTAVLSRDADGTIHWNPKYLDFADYYGFRPQACQPYRAQTKGKVESGVRYVRGNFWAGLTYLDLLDLNCQAWLWLDTVANVRIHGTTGEKPFDRLRIEPLMPLSGRPPYDTSLISCRRSSKDCFVSYQGNYYCVPAAHAGQLLTVKETEQGRLLILNARDEQIAEHELADGKNQRIVVAEHYWGISTLSQRPTRPTAVQVLPSQSPYDGLVAPQVESRALIWYDQFAEVVP